MYLSPKTFQIALLTIFAVGFILIAYELHMFRKDLMTLEELAAEEDDTNEDNRNNDN